MIISFLVIFLSLFTYPVFAELSANADTAGYSIENAMAEDQSGFFYRGGVDYQPTVTTPDPSVGFSVISGSMGCSGFNFASSFNSVFNEQALTDYMKNVSSAAIASAPNLLLQMLSPSLYDFIKNLSMLTQERLKMRYQQCEDIEAAVGGPLDKLRKKSEKECMDVKQKEGVDIDTATKFCKGQQDPFGFLKDADGKTIGSGGKINIIEDLLKKANIPKEKWELILKKTGDTEIGKNNVTEKPPKDEITQINQNNRQEVYDILISLIEIYRKDGIVSKEELEKLEEKGINITEQEIKKIALLPMGKRYIAIGKLASDLAFTKTIREYEDILQTLRVAILQQLDVDETQKDVLKNRYDLIKKRLEAFIAERDLQKQHNDTMKNIYTEEEEEKLITIINSDGTDSFFDVDAEKRDNVESYMPTNTETEKE